MNFDWSNERIAALVAPRNVAIVGASDRPGNWAGRARRNLARYGFPGAVYLINPKRSEIDGELCYPDVASLPEAPDHLLIVVPAPAVCEALERGARAGARSATILSSGFGEAFEEQGATLGRQLKETIRRSGLGVTGPNCMGNVCTKSRLVTLTEDRPMQMTPGPVALVGQSGGVMIFLNHALEERGMKAEYLITSGNEAGLQIADFIAYFASQPEIKVVIAYVEAVADAAKFMAACRLARAAGKSVVAFKLGQTESGRTAAMAHTGSLAGRIQAFDAMAQEAGVIRAETLDDAIEIAELLVHTGPTAGPRLGAITLSGAYRGILLDAAERAGVRFPQLNATTAERLRRQLSVGSMIGNPLDGGFGVLSSAETYLACVEALEEDPEIDFILLQESLPREPGSPRAESYIKLIESHVAKGAKKPIAFVTLVTHSQSDYSRNLRHQAERVSFLQEANKALRAVAACARRSVGEELSRGVGAAPSDETRKSAAAALLEAAQDARALDEAQSKSLLRIYGMACPQERFVENEEAAVEAARALGYPIALKGVATNLLHKSDVGAVQLDLRDEQAVRTGWRLIHVNLQKAGRADDFRGALASVYVKGGLEFALGLHRDPEIGPILMVGAGGVFLELTRDVSFGVPPMTPAKAKDMLERTQIGRRLEGYRGDAPRDAEALIEALCALGRLAVDFGSQIESIDVNPFAVLPKGQGGLILDAAVVLHERGQRQTL